MWLQKSARIFQRCHIQAAITIFILCSKEIMLLHHTALSLCLPNDVRALSVKYDRALEVQKIQISQIFYGNRRLNSGKRLNYYFHWGKACNVPCFALDVREFFSLYMLQTGKHQETLWSVFTSLHNRIQSQDKEWYKPDFIAWGMVE